MDCEQCNSASAVMSRGQGGAWHAQEAINHRSCTIRQNVGAQMHKYQCKISMLKGAKYHCSNTRNISAQTQASWKEENGWLGGTENFEKQIEMIWKWAILRKMLNPCGANNTQTWLVLRGIMHGGSRVFFLLMIIGETTAEKTFHS